MRRGSHPTGIIHRVIIFDRARSERAMIGLHIPATGMAGVHQSKFSAGIPGSIHDWLVGFLTKEACTESDKNELCQRIGDQGSGDFSTLDLRPSTFDL
jgi:hypothetical protein